MTMLRAWRTWTVALVLVVLAGCATPPKPQQPGADAWSGRLALQVKDNPQQSFTATFDLRGNARAGELELFNPLGGTIAAMNWTPGTATLRSNGQTHQYESVEALVEQATGTAVPIAALFDWLHGVATPVPGWQADLSQLASGRISATRTDPPPETSLRVAIER